MQKEWRRREPQTSSKRSRRPTRRWWIATCDAHMTTFGVKGSVAASAWYLSGREQLGERIVRGGALWTRCPACTEEVPAWNALVSSAASRTCRMQASICALRRLRCRRLDRHRRSNRPRRRKRGRSHRPFSAIVGGSARHRHLRRRSHSPHNLHQATNRRDERRRQNPSQFCRRRQLQLRSRTSGPPSVQLSGPLLSGPLRPP